MNYLSSHFVFVVVKLFYREFVVQVVCVVCLQVTWRSSYIIRIVHITLDFVT